MNSLTSKESLLFYRSFKHRFNIGSDISSLFKMILWSWKTHGSLGNHFLKHLSIHHIDYRHALIAVLGEWKTLPGVSMNPSLSFLLSSPEKGGACKRWNMYLRWMIRRDSVDPGPWNPKGALGLKNRGIVHLTRKLRIPLDTHVARISQDLELTRLKSVNWKSCQQITENLSTLDPEDPVRFDFSLCRLGILGVWKS